MVVDLPESLAGQFCREFPAEDFYISEEAVRDAIVRHSQFNIIHPQSGLKIDVMIPDASAFDRSRFSRARRVHTGIDWDASFATPEDVIIKKLEYFKEGRSDRHLRDIAGVLKTSGDEIDLAYIRRWVAELALNDVWELLEENLDEGG